MDEVISAEMSTESDPLLRELVLKHSIYNPSGPENTYSVFMKRVVCLKRFPKKLVYDSGS